MIHYYFDPKTNTLHGPMTQEYPEMTGNQMLDEDNLVEFWNHVRECPSIPHTFTGPSRVVPEGEIRWEYQRYNGHNLYEPWEKITEAAYLNLTSNRRRVATPINEEVKEDINHGETCYCNACASKRRLSEEASIPAHIVDDMKLDSYYDGFKNGQAHTSTSGEDGYNPKYYSYEEIGAGRIWEEMTEVEQLKYEINKLRGALQVSLNASKRRREKIEALTAQPDKPVKEPIKRHCADACNWPDCTLTGCVLKLLPPSPTPEQREKDAVNILREAIEQHEKDKQFLIDKYPGIENKLPKAIVPWVQKAKDYLAQQPHSPALTTDEEAAKAKVKEYITEPTGYGAGVMERGYIDGFKDGCTHIRSQQQGEMSK